MCFSCFCFSFFLFAGGADDTYRIAKWGFPMLSRRRPTTVVGIPTTNNPGHGGTSRGWGFPSTKAAFLTSTMPTVGRHPRVVKPDQFAAGAPYV